MPLLRFDGRAGASVPLDAQEFGNAMVRRLADLNRVNCDCAQILNVAQGLRYQLNGRRMLSVRALAAATIVFTAALHLFKQQMKSPHPTWTEVLGVLVAQGWRKRAD